MVSTGLVNRLSRGLSSAQVRGIIYCNWVPSSILYQGSQWSWDSRKVLKFENVSVQVWKKMSWNVYDCCIVMEKFWNSSSECTWCTLKAIAWSSVALSSQVFCGIHSKKFSQELLLNLIWHFSGDYTFKIIATFPMGQWVNGHNLLFIHKSFFYSGYSFYIQLISPWSKWPPFWQTTFSDAFSWTKSFVFWLKIYFFKVIPKFPVDNNPALVLKMPRCQIGNKPLFEPMLTRFTDTYMQRWSVL